MFFFLLLKRYQFSILFSAGLLDIVLGWERNQNTGVLLCHRVVLRKEHFGVNEPVDLLLLKWHVETLNLLFFKIIYLLTGVRRKWLHFCLLFILILYVLLILLSLSSRLNDFNLLLLLGEVFVTLFALGILSVLVIENLLFKLVLVVQKLVVFVFIPLLQESLFLFSKLLQLLL